MFRTILPLALLFSSASALAAGTPGTVEYFIHNDVNGKPYSVGRVPNHPWPARVTTPPFTFGTMTRPVGTALMPTYAPQRVTAQSFARGMFNALVRRHPYVTAATVAWGIYECATAESGWCFGNDDDNSAQCAPNETYLPGYGCAVVAPEDSCRINTISNWPAAHPFNVTVVSPPLPVDQINEQCPQDTNVTEYRDCANNREYSYTLPEACSTEPFQVTMTRTSRMSQRYNPGPPQEPAPWQTTDDSYQNIQMAVASWIRTDEVVCPESHPLGPVKPDGELNQWCYYVPDPQAIEDVTLEGLQDLINRNPELFDTVPDNVLTNPLTGKPDDTFFDNPKSIPMSTQLSGALASLAAGLAQFTNPSAPHYYPPELKDQLQDALDKLHNGQPFTDPFTNTTVTPDPAPTEPNPYVPPTEITIKQSWEDFPGITQEQYEQSNESWASDLAGRLPQDETDWTTFDDDFKDSISDNPDLPFEPFNFGTLWPITGGQCTGFARTVSVAGTTKTIMFDRHCPPYNEWAHPFLSWFLQILAALQILTIFNRTILSGAN